MRSTQTAAPSRIAIGWMVLVVAAGYFRHSAAEAVDPYACRHVHSSRAIRYPSVGSSTSCPNQDAYSCCTTHDDENIARLYAACLLAGTDVLSAACCDSLKTLSCSQCSGQLNVPTGGLSGICPSACNAAYQACAGSMFAASDRGGIGTSGSLSPCSDDSVLCARLSDMVQEATGGAGYEKGTDEEGQAGRIAPGKLFCQSLGYSVAAAESSCYDGSRLEPPRGWKPGQDKARAARQKTTVQGESGADEGRGSAGSRGHALRDTVTAFVAKLQHGIESGDPAVGAGLATAVLAVLLTTVWKLQQNRQRQADLAGYMEDRAVGGEGGKLSADAVRARRLAKLDQPASRAAGRPVTGAGTSTSEDDGDSD